MPILEAQTVVMTMVEEDVSRCVMPVTAHSGQGQFDSVLLTEMYEFLHIYKTLRPNKKLFVSGRPTDPKFIGRP